MFTVSSVVNIPPSLMNLRKLISISNYTGEGRDYLRKLIEAMGARFTPNMSSQNTVLVAAL